MESIKRKLWSYLPPRWRPLVYGLVSGRSLFRYRANRWTNRYHRDFRPFSYDTLPYLAFRDQHRGALKVGSTELWSTNLQVIEQHFLQKNNYLLLDPNVAFAISLQTWDPRRFLKSQLHYLEAHYTKAQLSQLIKEDHSLFPPIANKRYLTSEMLPYHLTHLTVFHEKGAPPRGVSFGR